MVMLCFLLDLRSISPRVLRVLKLSLLQLGNLYSVSGSAGYKSKLKALNNRIGLCYIYTDRYPTCSDELVVAYEPSDEFSLHKFHHAVDSLPTNAFSPKINDSGAISVADMKFASFFNRNVLYKWGGHEKDVSKKVILISSCVSEELDSVKKNILMDAAEKCVSIDFLLLEQKSSHLDDLSENINNFVKQISDLENCSFHTYLPDPQVLGGLVKRWLLDLKDDIDEPLQARFIFKNNIFGSVNGLSCTLSATSFPLIDGFGPCQTCRCHGVPVDQVPNKTSEQFPLCPVTGDTLDATNFVKKSLKVGKHTVLVLPSFGRYENLQHVSQPVDLNVIERTSLGSLSEAVLVGTSFLVSPTAYCDSDDVDKSELNTQVFKALCSGLHSLDQGLVCSSKCNIETKMESLFHCYYILEPSEKGLMLLRRLVGSEEALPFPDVSQLASCSETSEMGNSVLASLLKMEARDYNPSLHERGFHQKLNLLMTESLQPGVVIPLRKEVNIEPDAFPDHISSYAAQSNPDPNVVFEEITYPKRTRRPKRVGRLKQHQDSDSITEEWEQLVVSGGPKISSPKFVPTPKSDQVVLSSQDPSRKNDEKTLRILERLEVPRQLKRESPIIKSTATDDPDSSVSTKAPLIPIMPIPGSQQNTQSSQPMNRESPIIKSTATDDPDLSVSTKAPLIPIMPIPGSQENTQPSQPMKPNFQRNKKRQR